MTRRHEIRHAEVTRAARDLGVERPVHIAFNGQYRSQGRYLGLRQKYGRYEFDEPTHVITLGITLHGLPLRRARQVILHELTHAAQRDRYATEDEWARAAQEAYQTSRLGVAQLQRNYRAYWSSPFEVEARENEEFAEFYEVLR